MDGSTFGNVGEGNLLLCHQERYPGYKIRSIKLDNDNH
jgi:hypothetical protein